MDIVRINKRILKIEKHLSALKELLKEETQVETIKSRLDIKMILVEGNDKIPSFEIGETPVTQGQWREIMGINPSHFKNCDDCPVETVSWEDAKAFISRLNQRTGKNYRLPSEKEWEFAAMGGNKSNGYEYAGSNNLAEVAWYSGNNNNGTRPVGWKKPNELGLYDMTGNVWEWCEDDWHDKYSKIPDDGSARIDNPRSNYRVCRGGSWFNGTVSCIISCRLGIDLKDCDSTVGFRLCRSI